MNEDQNNEGTTVPSLDTNDNHDQIMAHFQEITNFYEMEQCLAILESTQWNLDQAIQSFFNNGGMTEQMQEDNDIQEIEPTSLNGPMMTSVSIGANFHPSAFSIDNLVGPQINQSETQGIFATGTSILPQTNMFPANNPMNAFEAMFPTLSSINSESKKTPNRLINFNIEYFQKKFTLHMPDNESLLSLKELIAQEIDLPVKNQKLKGWKNKDAKITDHMLLRDLNLPLENNLFVINTSDKDDASIYGSNNVKIDKFELNIKVLKNKSKNQVTIVNNSETSVTATETFKTDEKTLKECNNYHLYFEPNVKFIEIKRKINMLTKLNTNEQEWWLYLNSMSKTKEDKEDEEETCLEVLIENGSLFNMPLTVLIENDMKLIDLKILIDNLTETNTKISSSESESSSNSAFTALASSLNNIATKNSKLTPENTESNVLQMSFLVTQKKKDSYENLATELSNENVLPGKSSFDEDAEIIEEDDSHCDISIDEDDLDDNFLIDTTPKHKPLIPVTCPTGDEFLGTTMFIEEFYKRYQPLVPVFYNGTLENAIKEAVTCPARDRKLLGIYLHSDNSVCRHIFCSKTLCDENVVNFLTANFVVWPWDLTNKEHEAHFYTSCSKYLGSVVTSHLRTNKIEFPAFLIVNRTRGTNEVIAVIEGTASSETMMHRIMQSFEMFDSQRVTDMRDESERDERELIKSEQDAAYQLSLEADKAKDKKQDEEQDRIRKQAKEEEQFENERLQNREKMMQSCREKLPTEPADNAPPKSITRIRFRLPNGEMLQRKFFIENNLEALFNYLTANGYFSNEYKVLSSWPRRDLTTESNERTIEELKLFPQETLTIEER